MGRRNARRLGDAGFFLLLLLVVVVSVAGFSFHAQRLQSTISESYRNLVQVENRHALDHLVHTLDAVNLALLSLPQVEQLLDPSFGAGDFLVSALTHQPHLRSISLVSPEGLVVASSAPSNLGLRPDLTEFIPDGEPGAGVLRIGPAYAGRDLSDGVRIVERNSAPEHLEYFPVARSVETRDRQQYTLLAVINVDYFLNRIIATAHEAQERIDIVRYDGHLLFSTAERALSNDELQAVLRIAEQWAQGEYAGLTELTSINDSDWVSAWRLARILPVGAVSWLDKDVVLADARDELRRQKLVLFAVLALLLAIIILSFATVRRASDRYLAAQKEASRKLVRLLDALPANVLMFGDDGRIQVANRSWHDCVQRHTLPLVNDDRGVHYREISQLFVCRDAQTSGIDLEHGVTAVLEGDWKSFDGEFSFEGDHGERWIQVMVRPFSHDGDRGFVMLQLDVTDRHRAEEGMEMLDAALNATANAIVITNTDAIIEWANPAFARLTGWSASEAIGRRPKELVKSGKQDKAFYEKMWQTILKGEVWRGELVNRHRAGHHYHEALTITPVRDKHGVLRHFVAVKEDITERKELVAQLTREATTDPLTGVLNRRAFVNQVEAEMARAGRHSRCCALLMFDLDHFKRVNDTHGHAAGDEVLRHVTACASAALRRIDRVGRLGGEEFGILLPETALAGAIELAERLRCTIEEMPIRFEGYDINITTSVGLTMIGATDTDAEHVLARADANLYKAKAGGRNRIAYEVCAL